MKDNNKTIMNYLEYLGVAYFAEIILLILLLIYGRDFFVKNDSSLGALISIGMLTFVSIFFSFLYSLTNLQKIFHKFIDLSTSKMKDDLIKQIRKDDDLKNIIKTKQDIESLKNLKKWVNPEMWLYSSILLYLTSMVFALISNGLSKDATIASKNIEGFLFYLGLTCTFFLITSIICLTFISRQKNNLY